MLESLWTKDNSCYDNINGYDAPTLCTIDTVACTKVVYLDGTMQKFCARKCNAGTYSDGSVYCCYDNLCNNSNNYRANSFLNLFLFFMTILYKFLNSFSVF